MAYLSNIFNFLLRSSTLVFAGIRWLVRSKKNRRHAALAVGATLLVSVAVGEMTLESRHLPWRPLAIDDRAGFATGFKLRLIDLGPSAWCQDLLAESKLLQTRLLEAHVGKNDCGWSQAYHVEESGGVSLSGKSTYAMQCDLAVGVHIWIRSIDQHAQEILGSGLKRIHHFGTYSCRRMYNRDSGRLSEHAFAKAWDVSGFELEDDRIVSVLSHWKKRGPMREFLRAVHNDACRVFNVTLGPDYNTAHHDHFHVDVGGGVSCR